MTVQYGEQLLVDGEWVSMACEPLAEFFALGGRDPGFESTITALWRGYIGQWTIESDRLYLTDIQGKLKDGTKARLESVFPGFTNRVFAHWFSGVVRVPRGQQRRPVHAGHASVHDHDEMIEFDRGVLVRRWLTHNGSAGASQGSRREDGLR